eukprot:11710320-Alexandrium_andersonii.AAC.1
MVRVASTCTAALSDNERLRSCLEVFKAQFPNTRQAKTNGRAQAPPPQNVQLGGVVNGMLKFTPPRATREIKTDAAMMKSIHKLLTQ